MKILLYLFAFLVSFGLYAQSYDDKSEASELCLLAQQNSFMNDEKAEIALNKVLSVIGASKRFIMQPCSDINNAVATSYKGLRYILYDKEFMNTIAENTTAWSQLFILAHEVGHHINGHSIDILLVVADVVEPETLAAKRQQELESDEFAGFILGKLGATFEQTSEAVNLLASNKDDSYSTHPNKIKRLNAIKVGYDKALGKKPIAYDKPTKLQTAEEYFYRAYKKAELKDHKGAIADYTKAIELNPNDAIAYYNRAREKDILKDYYGSIADNTKAIELNPNDASAFNNRGNAKVDLKDHKGAIADYTKAIELNPNDAIAYYNRGNLKDHYGAIADYTKAIKLNPNYAIAFDNRGNSKARLKDYKGAIADYTKAIELNPNDAITFNNRGNSKVDLKDYYGAIADYTKAIKLNPNYAIAYFNRGNSKGYLKDHYGAIADYTKAIKLNPNGANAYYNRGIEKHYLADKQGACQDGRKAQNLGHDASQLINASCN